MEEIAIHLELAFTKGLLLTGILYLYPISDMRFYASSVANLKIFQNLCGDDAYKNVLLVTTHWHKGLEKQSQDRLKELKETGHFFGDMISMGAQLDTFDNTAEDGMRLLNLLVGKQRIPVKLQQEIVEQGLSLVQTSAGKVINKELIPLEEYIRRI